MRFIESTAEESVGTLSALLAIKRQCQPAAAGWNGIATRSITSSCSPQLIYLFWVFARSVARCEKLALPQPTKLSLNFNHQSVQICLKRCSYLKNVAIGVGVGLLIVVYLVLFLEEKMRQSGRRKVNRRMLKRGSSATSSECQ